MNGDGMVFEQVQGELRDLTDDALLERLDELANQERALGALMVAHLVEVERRGLHLKWGHASIYKYCVERLGITEDVAYKRMQAARGAALYPEVLDHLASGQLTLTSLRMITPHLEEFGTELIDAARGKSTRSVQRLVAELAARPEPDRVKMEPVVGGRVRIEVIADGELEELIEEAVNLDRHIDPKGDVGTLLIRALSGYVKQRRKARFADLSEGEADAPSTPTPERPGDGEKQVDLQQDSIPAAIKRATVERDGLRCTWEGSDGRRCTEQGFLELDHKTPRAKGGDHSKVRVLCRAHNQYAADLEFGSAFMDAKRGKEKKNLPRGRRDHDWSHGGEGKDLPRGRNADGQDDGWSHDGNQNDLPRGRRDQDSSHAGKEMDLPRGRCEQRGGQEDGWPRGRGFLTRAETIAGARRDLMTICDFTAAEADARIREVLPQMRPDFFVQEQLWLQAREAHLRCTGTAMGSARG